ncbi:dolichol-phosphate mannose synthase subunit 2 isoform X1 [Cajanus cajan]|nr:dolichol-phosphate mannose synthase subunit 2 isoform X1 [Cajanus cajan]
MGSTCNRPLIRRYITECGDLGILRTRIWRVTKETEVKAISIKMDIADRAVGFLLSFISLSIFTYYTFWVIILPFVDDDHFVHKYFLPQEYAILIPVSAGVALLCFLSIFVGFVMLKSKKKKA